MHHLHHVLVLHVVLLHSWLFEDGVGAEVARLGSSVVADARLVVQVDGHDLLELFELVFGDREDNLWNEVREAKFALWLGLRALIDPERIFGTHQLLSQERVVNGDLGITFLVLCPPSIENGGDERVIHVTTVEAIKHDGEGHKIGKQSGVRISENEMELHVHVVAVECMLRGRMIVGCNGHRIISLSKGIGGIEVKAREAIPVGGDCVREREWHEEVLLGEIRLGSSSRIIFSGGFGRVSFAPVLHTFDSELHFLGHGGRSDVNGTLALVGVCV